MDITVTIPDSVLEGLRVPQGEAEERLRTELAVALYRQQILVLGKAAELAGSSRIVFGALLGQRRVPRHYTTDDLSSDIAHARGE